MVAETIEIDLIEQKARRLQPCVVTWDAVLIHDGALTGGIRSRGTRHWRGRCGTRCPTRWSRLRRHHCHSQADNPHCHHKMCFHADSPQHHSRPIF
jgi:hypothetical protein